MSKRITVYLDQNTVNALNHYENKSQIINEVLHYYFHDNHYFINQRDEIEEEIHFLKLKLAEKNQRLNFLNEQIERIDKDNQTKPLLYEETVDILNNLDEITEEDLIFHAQKLHVKVPQLKEWLCEDGILN